MAIRKYIIKQNTNWNGRGERSGTHTVILDDAEVASYISMLDGKIEVYEQNLALSVDVATATTSLSFVDSIRLSHSASKTIYISNTNKRPIVFKNGIRTSDIRAHFAAVKPFPAPYASDVAKDVSIDSGNITLL